MPPSAQTLLKKSSSMRSGMKKREQNFDIYRGYLANSLLHGVEQGMESKSYKFHPGTMGWHYATIGSNITKNLQRCSQV
jgi:hypothetical protein